MALLVTGGAGYIGSHTCVKLLSAGYKVVVLDNFCNASARVFERMEQITGRRPALYQADLLDTRALDELFCREEIEAVLHFAALKSAADSIKRPFAYYQTNVAGTLNLCRAMARRGVKNMVFSSSAAVYGSPKKTPVPEDEPLFPQTPYGKSKLVAEQMLLDFHRADPGWNAVLLRYFNPIGAHESGLIGESPKLALGNLMPELLSAALGKSGGAVICGGDYPTKDGTGVRDFVHVEDIAAGHLLALRKLSENPGVTAYNLGSGYGTSVLEVLRGLERACGRRIPYHIAPRRACDVDICYADIEKARRELHYRPQKTLSAMCKDAWRFASENPDGI